MQLAVIILVAAATFGLCFLFDKGFQKTFRSKAQHRSGRAVRLNKMYSIAGICLAFLGVCAIVTGAAESSVLFYAGFAVLAVGLGLCVYHLSFGIFYDEDSFLCTGFGKKERIYRFCDIRSQKLYLITGGSIIVELLMADHTTVSIHTTMDGAYPFLDAAFQNWCRQTGTAPETCDFHDPANHLWFPSEDT